MCPPSTTIISYANGYSERKQYLVNGSPFRTIIPNVILGKLLLTILYATFSISDSSFLLIPTNADNIPKYHKPVANPCADMNVQETKLSIICEKIYRKNSNPRSDRT